MAIAIVLGNCPPLFLLSQASRIDSELPSQPPLGPGAVPIVSMRGEKSSSLYNLMGRQRGQERCCFPTQGTDTKEGKLD